MVVQPARLQFGGKSSALFVTSVHSVEDPAFREVFLILLFDSSSDFRAFH
jgi:hypothetical protein